MNFESDIARDELRDKLKGSPMAIAFVPFLDALDAKDLEISKLSNALRISDIRSMQAQMPGESAAREAAQEEHHNKYHGYCSAMQPGHVSEGARNFLALDRSNRGYDWLQGMATTRQIVDALHRKDLVDEYDDLVSRASQRDELLAWVLRHDHPLGCKLVRTYGTKPCDCGLAPIIASIPAGEKKS